MVVTEGPLEAGFPSLAELTIYRGWLQGMSSREAVERLAGEKRAAGESSRAVVGKVRRQLVGAATIRHRPDLAALFMSRPSPASHVSHLRAVEEAIALLRRLPAAMPVIADDLARWLAPRLVRVLEAQGIRTLAELTLRIPRRRMWWAAVPGLGKAGARSVEQFFAQHPALTEKAMALFANDQRSDIVPLERLQLSTMLDGSQGTFRAPVATCILSARNDREAIQAWLALHESDATARAYRKEAERLVLWATVELGKPLSSLTTEDAISYRSFLRRPAPRGRWVGPPRPRTATDWRPFADGLASKSVAYALAVLGALFRWLIEQRYVLANPFAGVKVRGAAGKPALDANRAFSEGEWGLVRAVADGLEWSYGWSEAAAHRLRFILDFGYATGLRAGELVGRRLGDLKADSQGVVWLELVGKGAKSGRVAVPSLARAALDHYLVQRGLSTIPSKHAPNEPLLANLAEDGAAITPVRLRAILRRFFDEVANVVESDSAATAQKLRKATPHWMRHTHATHALDHGVELTAVRDNLRHASVSTTSTYLHADESRRSRQMEAAFAARG